MNTDYQFRFAHWRAGTGGNDVGIAYDDITIVGGFALPVTFGTIKALQKSNDVEITWSTFTERNVSNFEIERSSNGRQFNSLGRVNAVGNSDVKNNYAFVDNLPVTGNNFYRIKSIDLNGSTSYSKIVKVNTAEKNSRLTIFPNPVESSTISFQASSLPRDQYRLQVHTYSGQLIHDELFSHPGGSFGQTINISAAVKPGTYNLKLSSREINLIKTFVIK